MSTLFPVVIASGFHLFPFRTEKLSPTAPMVLRKRESRSPPSYFQVEALPARLLGGLFVSLYHDDAALFRRVFGAFPSRSRCSSGVLVVLFHCAVPLFILQPQVVASTKLVRKPNQKFWRMRVSLSCLFIIFVGTIACRQ